MYMIMFVLDNNEFMDKILDSWHDVGITGATIIESSGFHRRRLRKIPMRYSYGDSLSEEVGNTTFFVIVKNQESVQLCLEATEKIVGNLDDPNTGVFSAWPLTTTKGIPT